MVYHRYDATNQPNIALRMYPMTRPGYAAELLCSAIQPLSCSLCFLSARPTCFLGNKSCSQKRGLPHCLYHLNTITLCLHNQCKSANSEAQKYFTPWDKRLCPKAKGASSNVYSESGLLNQAKHMWHDLYNLGRERELLWVAKYLRNHLMDWHQVRDHAT